MSADAVYNTIGRGYSERRRSDPRIAARLMAALGDARTVLNVGAGAGWRSARGWRASAWCCSRGTRPATASG